MEVASHDERRAWRVLTPPKTGHAGAEVGELLRPLAEYEQIAGGKW